MTIKEFAEKYKIDKRSIDYWTNIGLLHPDQNESNGYRQYGENAEEEIKLILIAKAMNIGSIEDTVELVKNTPKIFVDQIVIQRIKIEMEKAVELYKTALQFAEAIKNS